MYLKYKIYCSQINCNAKIIVIQKERFSKILVNWFGQMIQHLQDTAYIKLQNTYIRNAIISSMDDFLKYFDSR